MSLENARALVARARKAVETKDTDGLLAMFTSDAVIMERNPDEFREIVGKAFGELHGQFSMETRDVRLDFEARAARVTFIMDLGQKDSQKDIVYYPNVQIRARLEKNVSPRWLGLFEVEEWKVKRLDADPPILPKKLDM